MHKIILVEQQVSVNILDCACSRRHKFLAIVNVCVPPTRTLT